MKHLSALDIAFLASELAKFKDSKLQQVYQPSKKELILQFHIRAEGRALLKVRVPEAIYLAGSREEAGEVSGFCSILRRKLNGASTTAVSQVEFERIIRFDFTSKNSSYSLFLELFSKGNIILESEGKIVAAAEKQLWATRKIATGQFYNLPPAVVNPKTLDEKKLLELLKSTSKTDLVRFLAMELSLGGLYAEELCLSSGMDKKAKPSTITTANAKKLLQHIKKLIKSKLSPSLIYEKGVVLDVVPTALNYYKNYESKPAKSFSEALEIYYSSTVKVTSKYDKELVKINSIIDKQKETMTHLEDEITVNSRRGELIYEHYQDIKKLLDFVEKTRKEEGWPAVKKQLKPNKKIKYIDEKTGKIIVDL